MRTLIFNGSPRANGDTEALISGLTAHLDGEVRTISCRDGIGACVDCRYCWTHQGCAVSDGMQEVYAYLALCDNVVLASPIWFSSLSGPLLNLASRLQTLFAARHFRKEPVAMTPKRGAILLVGAEPGTDVMPEKNALTILKLMNVDRDRVEVIRSMRTDVLPASEDEGALARCRALAERWTGSLTPGP